MQSATALVGTPKLMMVGWCSAGGIITNYYKNSMGYWKLF
jgi:hypothetical protein